MMFIESKNVLNIDFSLGPSYDINRDLNSDGILSLHKKIPIKYIIENFGSCDLICVLNCIGFPQSKLIVRFSLKLQLMQGGQN